MDTDNNVVRAGARGQGLGGGGQKGEKGDICNSLNNKKKEQILFIRAFIDFLPENYKGNTYTMIYKYQYCQA